MRKGKGHYLMEEEKIENEEEEQNGVHKCWTSERRLQRRSNMGMKSYILG